MFKFKFIKFLPSEYVLRYNKGKIVQEGAGLSFFYYVPVTSVVVIPIASADVPFVFEEVTNDYQTVTVQGQIVGRHARIQSNDKLISVLYRHKTTQSVSYNTIWTPKTTHYRNLLYGSNSDVCKKSYDNKVTALTM